MVPYPSPEIMMIGEYIATRAAGSNPIASSNLKKTPTTMKAIKDAKNPHMKKGNCLACSVASG
jgi:hypothetical protein